MEQKVRKTVVFQYLEPINGAAVDQRGELPEPVPEGVPNGAHGQHHMQLVPHTRHKQVVQRHHGAVRLLGLVTGSSLINTIIVKF